MRYLKLFATLSLTFTLAACAGPLPFFGKAAIPREAVEADLRAKLADSQVSTFTLEMQSIRWVDEHMPARYGEPISFGEPGHAPDRQVWVAFIEGRLSPSIWPGGTQSRPTPGKSRPPEAPATPPRSVQAFSKALMLIDSETGGLVAMIAKPEF